MKYLLLGRIIQIVVSVLLVLLILIQSKGTGLSGSIGSSITFYRSRRGLEKLVLFLTIFFGIVFVANSLILVIFTK